MFGLLQVYGFLKWVQGLVPASDLKVVFRWALLALAALVGLLIFLSITGNIPFLTGRLYSLLGATTNMYVTHSHRPSALPPAPPSSPAHLRCVALRCVALRCVASVRS